MKGGVVCVLSLAGQPFVSNDAPAMRAADPACVQDRAPTMHCSLLLFPVSRLEAY